MGTKRKNIPIATKKLVLHESGYKCGNPICRTIITLDIHHLELVSEGGDNSSDNLLPLCPNCHALHHKGEIPIESLRAWKLILLSINEGYDRRAVDILLALDHTKSLYISGDGVLECASLVASKLISVREFQQMMGEPNTKIYLINLTERGRLLVEGWKRGNQQSAIDAFNKD